jgi:hypothetical protein
MVSWPIFHFIFCGVVRRCDNDWICHWLSVDVVGGMTYQVLWLGKRVPFSIFHGRLNSDGISRAGRWAVSGIMFDAPTFGIVSTGVAKSATSDHTLLSTFWIQARLDSINTITPDFHT